MCEELSLRRHKHRGLSLIEVLVALLILVIGVASVFALFGVALRAQQRSVDAVTIARMARTILAELRANPGKFPLSSIKQQHLEGFPKYYTYSISFTPVADMPGLYMAEVVITWQGQGTQASQAFKTLVLRR
jgi:prepilin-type N-terminal cleavage/methylation domain-containing protein